MRTAIVKQDRLGRYEIDINGKGWDSHLDNWIEVRESLREAGFKTMDNVKIIPHLCYELRTKEDNFNYYYDNFEKWFDNGEIYC